MNRVQRHNRITDVLQAAISADPDDRDAIIAGLCDGDAELIQEVQSLLRHEPQAHALLDSPIVNANTVIDYRPKVLGSGTLKIPGFTLKGILGQGSSSIVYHAVQHNPQREVAIKVLRPLSCSQQATSRIQAEAHLLARLEHQAIARIHEVGVIESALHTQPFLVMDYVRSEPLSEYLKDNDLPFDQRLELVLDLCEIFEYAHKNGVVHRDIKPSNILIHKDPQTSKLVPKVIDFGIAKLIHGQAIPIDIQTINPEVFGTLRYMSPERRSGKTSGDAFTSDIYSIGVLAAEILDGTLCNGRSHATSNSQPSESSPTLPKPITQVLGRMINPEPALRFESVQAAAIALRRASSCMNASAISYSFARSIQNRRFTAAAFRASSVAGVLLVFMILPGSVILNEASSQSSLEYGFIAGIPGAITKALEGQQVEEDPKVAARLDVLNARTRLIGDHALNGYHEEAARMIQLAESEFGDMSGVPAQYKETFLFAKGYALTQARNFEGAMQAYISAKELLSLDGELTRQLANDWRGIAHGIQSCGDYQTARQMYQQLIGHPSYTRLEWPLRSTIMANFAGLYWLEQDNKSAELMFRRIVDSAPANQSTEEAVKLAQFQSSLGVVLTSSNKLQEGEIHIKNALEVTMRTHRISDPVVCRMYRNLAKNYFHQGKYEDCISVMVSVRTVWAAMPESWQYNLAQADFLLGSAFLEIGDLEQALGYLNRARGSCATLEGASAGKMLSNIENALGAALCDSGLHDQGKALMASSMASIITYATPSNPWVIKAISRWSDHAACQ